MAAKRETPRQKMIGMMYLVLTALLALQVSSALIYKFQALNTSLEKTVSTTDEFNRERQKNIMELVKNRGNKPTEVELAKSAKEIRRKTSEMLGYIEQIKKELVEKTGGYDANGDFKGAKEETQVEILMIGASKKTGKAYLLKKELDDYMHFMNTFSDKKIASLAMHAFEDPALQNNSEQKNKDYAHLNFGQTPLVAALAVLSETESKIVNIENSILASIHKKIGDEDYTFDKLKPMVKPSSDFVVAGTKYEAEMFMVATSSSLKPQMQFNDNGIHVDEDGIGALSFVASGGNYSPNGTIKKTWKGKITMKKPNGTDTTYRVEHEYTVVKPVIQVQSGVVNALYRNCGNKLNISVPSLGAEYNPTFEINGAEFISGDRPGQITVVPKGATGKVKMKVNNKGNFIGQEDFGVKLIPLPTVDVKINNKKISPMEGIDYRAARSVTISIVPDKSFAESLPSDAKYQITEGKVYLARGRKEVGFVDITSPNVSLNKLAPEMRQGDRLIVEVSKVKRTNFKNESEEVPLPKHFEIVVLN